VLVLIFLNGFYVAGEFALVAVDRSKMEQMAADGHRGAISTLAGLKTLSFQLSGAQLGITVTSLMVGFILEPTLGETLRGPLVALGLPEKSALGASLVIALVLATASQMVLGELVPKNLAIARPEGVSFAVTAPLRLSNILFKPLIVFLNASANWTVRRFGIEPQDELIPMRSLKELEVLIESSREGGLLQEEEYSLLSRSISFGEKTAANALVPRVNVVTLAKSDTLSEMARISVETGHSRFPVMGADIDDIVGVAHVKDSYGVEPRERPSTPVSAIMQEALVTPESRDLKSLLLDMRRGRGQLAVIVDEYGGTAGIVTVEDLLEEIVGEIEDEYDPAQVTPTLESPEVGINRVSGLLHRDELLAATSFLMPEGEYDTLAGFLLTLFERVPEQGEHVSYGGWELKIVEMERNRISKVLLVKSNEGGSLEEDA
jgi:CBS domain containing-hemolysin-like protein